MGYSHGPPLRKLDKTACRSFLAHFGTKLALETAIFLTNFGRSAATVGFLSSRSSLARRSFLTSEFLNGGP